MTTPLATIELLAHGNEDGVVLAITATAATDATVTAQINNLVRIAVEELVRAIDQIDRDRNRALLEGFDERRLYEGAVTIMMRLVFLLYAEERDLIGVDQAVSRRLAVSGILRVPPCA